MSLFGNNSKPHARQPGMLETLFGSGKLAHRCTGDCRRCPSHYGYRCGSWHYGHDHTHGCEFGGNKGSGSGD